MTEPQTLTRTFDDGRTVYYDQSLRGWYDVRSQPLVQRINAGRVDRDPHSNGGYCEAGYCEACAARSRGAESV